MATQRAPVKASRLMDVGQWVVFVSPATRAFSFLFQFLPGSVLHSDLFLAPYCRGRLGRSSVFSILALPVSN